MSNLFLESREEESHTINGGIENEIVAAPRENEDLEVNTETEDIVNVTSVTENNTSGSETEDVPLECYRAEGYAGPMTRSRTKRQ